MGKLSSPSDFTSINPNYAEGRGYYTTSNTVAALLQIGNFTDTTTPSKSEVGELIKRAEDRVDSTTKLSWRPLIYQNEFHSFETINRSAYPLMAWKNYIGFIQLSHRKIQKIVRLEVWKGSQYEDIASATATITIPNSATGSSVSWRIRLTVGARTFDLVEGTHFYDTYGPKTTASQIVDAINEVYPAKTAKFTGETVAKSVTANGASGVHISDFFYATVDSDDSSKVVISSLLMGEDGTACTITSVDTDAGNAAIGSVTTFTDNEDSSRLGDFWILKDDGKIFFRNNYPYHQNHSIKVTYVSGSGRVPASIHDAATKIVAAEVIRHDDNSILIAETGSNIDLKTKHDILLEEADKILQGKKDIVHFIS
tara:strand:+ start:131 stop:1237 length:1107 start_codon:yes stop_codon:yes gene_type:complete